MAYMSQERKAAVAAALKGVVPSGWKYSLAVQNHSTLVMTISAAPVDLLAEFDRVQKSADRRPGFAPVSSVERGCLDIYAPRSAECFDVSLPIIEAINRCLYEGNHDRSDAMSDYFDVGWYVSLKIGRWDKPFVCTAPIAKAA